MLSLDTVHAKLPLVVQVATAALASAGPQLEDPTTLVRVLDDDWICKLLSSLATCGQKHEAFLTRGW